MSRLHRRKGSTYLLVVVVFIFVSLFSALMLSNVSQSIFQINTYGLQMQCYYLNQQAAEATVAVLLDNDNELLNGMSYPQVDTMTHTESSGTVLGNSKITLTKEEHDYYGESKEWAVARIVTTIPDHRASRSGNDFNYVGSVMILIENPLVQLYNINPDDI
jgi:hypothetical protein